MVRFWGLYLVFIVVYFGLSIGAVLLWCPPEGFGLGRDFNLFAGLAIGAGCIVLAAVSALLLDDRLDDRGF